LPGDFLEGGSGVGGVLAASVLARFGGDPETICPFQRTAAPGDYAAMAPLVIDAAFGGDKTAIALLQRAGDDLGAMLRRLHAKGVTRFSLIGGLAAFLVAYLPESERVRLSDPVGDAVDGALMLAREAVSG
jgi:glucosamine kinase